VNRARPIPPSLRLSRPVAPARVGLLALSLAAASGSLVGCAGTGSTDAPADTRSSELAPADAARDEGKLVTNAGSIRIVHDDWKEAGYRWQWSARPRIDGSGTLDRATVHDDLLVTIDDRGAITALDTTTGSVRWSAGVADPLTRLIGTERVGDTILVFTRPAMFAVDANTGNLLARQPMDVVVSTVPAIDGGTAIFGTPTGEVYAHEFARPNGQLKPPPYDRGARAWGYMIAGAITSDPIEVDGLIGMVSDAGSVFFVDPFTGAGVGRNSIWKGLDSDPVTDGARLFAASLDQSVYAFTPRGELAWRVPTSAPLRDQPTAWARGGDPERSVLFVNIPGEGLTAFDGPTGAVLWKNAQAGGEVVGIRAGNPVAFDGQSLFVLDATNGDIVITEPLRGVARVVSGDLVDGNLYAVGEDGTIAMFTPRR
jgi:outer membrane protein assembly factor BamB